MAKETRQDRQTFDKARALTSSSLPKKKERKRREKIDAHFEMFDLDRVFLSQIRVVRFFLCPCVRPLDRALIRGGSGGGIIKKSKEKRPLWDNGGEEERR